MAGTMHEACKGEGVGCEVQVRGNLAPRALGPPLRLRDQIEIRCEWGRVCAPKIYPTNKHKKKVGGRSPQ